MDFTNKVLPIRNYPEFDENGVRVLYLVPELEITAAEYNAIVNNIATDGPGWQVLKLKGKYFLHSDMNPTEAKKRIAKEVNERGGTFPTSA